VKPGREAHFLRHCGALSPEALVLFRDLEQSGTFWSPEKWASREALDAWRNGSAYKAALTALQDAISEHTTHLMIDVPGFSPRR
jgi:hypothetical protein